MSAIITDWKKPGQAVQMLVANSIGQYSPRNVRGQFRHIPSAREILLAQLREEYAPVRDIQPEGLISGSGEGRATSVRCGGFSSQCPAEIDTVSNEPTGSKSGPLPSHMPYDERIAHISVTVLATMALMLQSYWAPENMFVGAAVCLFIFGVGLASYLTAVLSR